MPHVFSPADTPSHLSERQTACHAVHVPPMSLRPSAGWGDIHLRFAFWALLNFPSGEFRKDFSCNAERAISSLSPDSTANEGLARERCEGAGGFLPHRASGLIQFDNLFWEASWHVLWRLRGVVWRMRSWAFARRSADRPAEEFFRREGRWAAGRSLKHWKAGLFSRLSDRTTFIFPRRPARARSGRSIPTPIRPARIR